MGVSVHRLLRAMGAQLQGASGRTDRNGECELAGVEPGGYEACVTHETWLSPKPGRLTIPAGGRVETSLVMQAGGSVAVRAVDHQGKPAAEQGFKLLNAQEPTRTGRTDATGRATLGPLPLGDYEVVLQTTPQGLGMLTWGQSAQQASGYEIGTRVRFEVRANKTVDVLLTLPRLASLTGVVRRNSLVR